MNTTDYADYADYKQFYKGDDEILSYFSNNPVSSWSFELFCESINKNKRRSAKSSTLLNSYLNQLNIIKQDPETPQKVKSLLNNLAQKAKKEGEETTKSVNYTITGATSVQIGDNNSIINAKDVEKKEKKKGDSKKKEGGDEYISEEKEGDELIYEEDDNDAYISKGEDGDKHISEEDSDDNDNIPSDLTVDHHPSRGCEYFFDQERVLGEVNDSGEIAQDEWVVGDLCVSEKCRLLKDNTLKLKKSPGSLSDIRLLAMNDIFIFDIDVNMSTSKYFRLEDHNAIISSLNTKKHRPEMGIKAHQWCQEIVDDPPHDWVASLEFGGRVLCEAVKEKNVVDMHTAHVLSQVLPLFISGSPDRSVEDSLVHNYLSQMLISVFSKDGRFKIKWANGELHKDSKFKPDFVVYSISINVKCVLVLGEFKKSTNYTAIESDRVKLGKQMRTIYNELVSYRVPNPVVCGIICQGDDIFTYYMDMISPKLYRMVKVSRVKLFRNVDELYFLPHIFSSIVQLKNIALETTMKAETSLIEAAENNHRNPPMPPTTWLSFESYRLCRKRRKESPSNE